MTDIPREVLLKRLREAKGADPEIDMLVADFFEEKKTKKLRVSVSTTHESGVFYPQDFDDVAKPYTGSIDAAVALVERVRPDLTGIIPLHSDNDAWLWYIGKSATKTYRVTGATPAIALVCALVMSMEE